MRVLSLFDGISCGQVALKQAGIGVSVYYASEIDKHAIKVTQANHPDTVQLGDVSELDFFDVPEPIDLLIGGSPCQGFSFAGKQLNFEDPRSKLFFEFVRLLRDLNPKHFMLENVNMKKEFRDVISEHLRVEPVFINSALVGRQSRPRWYWANFPIPQPEDAGRKLQDVTEGAPAAAHGRRLNKASIVGRRLDENGRRQDYDKTVPITQCLEVRRTGTDKSNCLTTVEKDTVLTELPPGRHPDAYGRKLPFRNYTQAERCLLTGLPANYCDEISPAQTVKATGNGWEVNTIEHIFRQLKALI